MKPPSYCWPCQKKAYGSEDEARQAIESLLRYRRTVPEYDYALRAYRCRHGNGYHFGHSTAVIATIKTMVEGR